MTQTAKEAPAGPGSPSVAEVMTGLAQFALREGVSEMSRAQGNRGKVYLNVELTLGDRGEVLWSTTSLRFENKLHVKDARGASNG